MIDGSARATYLERMYADARPLFYVTAVVVAGLALFVAYVLVKMREPWTRALSLAASAPDTKSIAAGEGTEIAAVDSVLEKKSEAQLDKPKKD